MDETFIDWLAKREATINDDLRLVMAGMQHIDARIKSLQKIALYIAVVLTAILVVMLLH